MLDAGAIDDLLTRALAGEKPQWPRNALGEQAAQNMIRRIAFHGVAGHLAALPIAALGWPETVCEHVRRQSIRQALWEESHRATVHAALAELGARSVDTRILKGTALAYGFYDTPELRPRGDTDLLVREEQLGDARAALEIAGMMRSADVQGVRSQESWVMPGAVEHVIDLHWEALDSPVLQGALPTESFFDDPIPLPRLGRDAWAPGKTGVILHGLLNQQWHRLFGTMVEGLGIVTGARLQWVMDNHLLFSALEPAEWQTLASVAKARGLAPLLLPAMREAEAHLHTQLDQAALDILDNAPSDTAVARYCAEPVRARRVFKDIAATPGLLPKSRSALNELFPPKEHLRAIYPDSTGWPVPALHLRRIYNGLRGAIAGR